MAIVINTSWNIYNFRLGLMKALQKEGYSVVAIAPEDNYSEKFNDHSIAYYPIDINSKGTNPIEDAKLVRSFYKLYKSIAPDIILQYTIKPNIYGTVAAGLLGIPVVSNITGLGTVFLRDKISSKIAHILYRIALKIPKKVFFQNIHDRDLFIKSKFVKAERADLMPGSGIDTEKFKPASMPEEEDTPLRFLFVARLLKDKGLHEYVLAARIVRDSPLNSQELKKLQFFILGAYYSGNPTAITENEMKDWEEEGVVSYLGVSDDVKSVIADYDCVVLPSYREGLSKVLLEAASMAKPIITANVPGCKEVVEDGVNGFLCETKSPESLADQMMKIAALGIKGREEMGLMGRAKVVDEFDEKIVIKKYLEVIKELLA